MHALLRPPFLDEPDAERVRSLTALRTSLILVGGDAESAICFARALADPGEAHIIVRRPIRDPHDLERRFERAAASAFAVIVGDAEHLPARDQEELVGLAETGWRTRPVRLLLHSRSESPPSWVPELAARVDGLALPVPTIPEDDTRPRRLRALEEAVAAELRPAARRLADDELTEICETEIAPVIVAIRRRLLVPGRATAGAGAPETVSRIENLALHLAHELKNPMVTVRTLAERIDDLPEDRDERNRFLALVAASIDRMDQSIERLLEFSRLSPPQPRPVGIRTVLPEDLRAASVDALPADQTVDADPEHLSLALSLLAEALRESFREGDTLEAAWREPSELVLRATGPALARRLHPMWNETNGAEASLPFSASLAREMLRRSGVRLTIAKSRDGAEARLTLNGARTA